MKEKFLNILSLLNVVSDLANEISVNNTCDVIDVNFYYDGKTMHVDKSLFDEISKGQVVVFEKDYSDYFDKKSFELNGFEIFALYEKAGE